MTGWIRDAWPDWWSASSASRSWSGSTCRSGISAPSPSGRVLLAVGILAAVCTAIAFLLFFALIGEVGPVRATVITYFNPAVALLLGVTLLREPLTVGAILGFGLILVGSVLATRRSSALAGAGASPSSNPWAVAAR